jgi:hypothetical protein
MDINLPIFQDLTLTIADKPDEWKVYPTSQLQKGFMMNYRGLDLAEEAVGFGLPVLKQGLQTIFPGNIGLDLQNRDSTWMVTAIYTMNLVEKIARPGTASVKSKYLYAAKNYLAAFIRQFPPIRTPLTSLSGGLRRLFGWETTYEDAGFSGKVKMVYTFNEPIGSLLVEADTVSLPGQAVTEVIVMNEQGAHTFDQYRDSSGIYLSGKEIGCWDEVAAEEASFVSSTHRIAFTLPRVAGAHLFRGRELIGSRLAWAGFGYSFPPTAKGFSYTVRFEKST